MVVGCRRSSVQVDERMNTMNRMNKNKSNEKG